MTYRKAGGIYIVVGGAPVELTYCQRSADPTSDHGGTTQPKGSAAAQRLSAAKGTTVGQTDQIATNG